MMRKKKHGLFDRMPKGLKALEKKAAAEERLNKRAQWWAAHGGTNARA